MTPAPTYSIEQGGPANIDERRKMSIYMTREQLNRINEAGRQGAALREAVLKGIITEEEAFDIISRPRLEEDEVDGAAIVPFPKPNQKKASKN